MHPGQRFVREHRARRLDSSLLGQRNHRAPGGFTRLGFEPLEERAMLSVSQDLLDELLPYQTAINTALDVMTSLPLVGEQFADLQEFNTILQDSLASLASHVDSLTNGHFELAIPLPSFSETFTFDLGLDAFLQFSSAGGVQASINPVLNVAFDITGGQVSLDADDSYLDIGFGLSLPNFTATASLNGLLHTEVADAGTVFAGHVELHFTEAVGIEVELSGSANIHFDLDLYFIDPDLDAPFNPHFSTRLDLVWGFNTATDQLAPPQIALRNFSLDVDSFFDGFLGDVLTTVQKFTGPMQPFIDVFDEPIPILSAFDGSETIGDLFLKGSGLSEEQQDRFELMVHIIRTVNTIDLSGSSGGAKINFGDIGLTGNPMQAWAFGFDTSQLTNGFQQIINLPELGHVEETLTKLASYTGIVSTAGLRFPLIENPDDVVAAILTGQIEPLFTFDTGRLHFELEASIGVGIKDILGIFLSAGITFDAQLAMGYDTAGLLKLIQTHNPADLLHGFYFDNSFDTLGPPVPNVPNPKKTGLYLQGHAKLEATAIVTISGGLYANIAVELASTDTSSHVHLDSMISNLASGAKVFNLSGAFYAAANISLELPNPVGPDITIFDFELARYDLINNDPPPPATFDRPLSVIDVTNQHTLALDVTKMGAGYTTQVRPVHNMSVSIDGTVKEVDGIRVDYASEIVIYVMRKDDVTTNYYNLITLSGTPADRTSISIQDPFNVFEDEGAPNPAPSQTEPTIVLVGGTSVAYHYADSSNRSNPTVLLAGGRGFNHLTGGTMMFGNFIPAARIDQAKNHLGNVSGIDPDSLGLIYSQIDAAVLPASTAGITGANMTGSRGGLMLGGVGANSFVANGPGQFEMIGGPWENNFTIRPSFGGVPATYDIDGGGGEQPAQRLCAGGGSRRFRE